MQARDFFAVFDRSVAWGIYLGGACVVLAILFWLTRRWQHNIRWLTLALIAVAMLLPAPVPGFQARAPAFAVVGLAAMTHSVDVVAPVLVKFLFAVVLVVVVVIVEGIWWHRRNRRQAAARRSRTQVPAKR